jgi:hypothetical protein
MADVTPAGAGQAGALPAGGDAGSSPGAVPATTARARLSGAAGGKLAGAGQAARGKIAGGQWLRAVLARTGLPDAPATQPWRLSVPALVARHPKIPAAAAWPLRKLGRIGEVMVGPAAIGFDGRDVPWDRVLEVRVHATGGLVPDAVADREIRRIRELLPPVPGRTWVLGQLVTVLLALAGNRANSRGDQVIACEIVYRTRLGRVRQHGTGLLGAAILAAFPAVNQAIIATARSRGVPVSPAPAAPGRSRAERAGRMRAAASLFAQRVRALIASADDDLTPGADPG